MAFTGDRLQGLKEASADYCAKLATLHEANRGVPDPAGVVTSLLPAAIKEAKKDAARCVREFEESVAGASTVAREAVGKLRECERQVEARGTGGR